MSALTGVIGPGSLFLTGTYAVTRTATGTYVDGRYVAGSTSGFNIDASIQPAVGRMLRAAPEGLSGEEQRLVLTTTALRAQPPGDQITIGGEPWLVFHAEDWNAFGGYHCRAWAARKVVP